LNHFLAEVEVLFLSTKVANDVSSLKRFKCHTQLVFTRISLIFADKFPPTRSLEKGRMSQDGENRLTTSLSRENPRIFGFFVCGDNKWIKRCRTNNGIEQLIFGLCFFVGCVHFNVE
jgi:hypothetical protein